MNRTQVQIELLFLPEILKCCQESLSFFILFFLIPALKTFESMNKKSYEITFWGSFKKVQPLI